MNNIKALVFDLDRTLYDRWSTLRGVCYILKKRHSHWWRSDMCFEQLYEEFHDSDCQHIYGGWEEVYEDFKRKRIFCNPPDVDTFRDEILECFKVIAVPIPTVREMLEEFRASGYKLGIITNGESKLQWKKVELLDFIPLFDCILVSGDLECAKPEPKIFQLMADTLNVKPEEMMFIGDGPYIDVQGAYNFGCIPIFIKTSGEWRYPNVQEPYFQLSDVTELPMLLQGINNTGRKQNE